MGFTEEQKLRLDKLGDVTYFDDMCTSPEDWLSRCQGFEIVCSWMAGLRDKYSELKDVFISVPFVGVGTFADPKILKDKNITISNSPGCNRQSVAEWIIYMLLSTTRRLDTYLKTSTPVSLPFSPKGLADKKITILGNGNIGKTVSAICEAMGMSVMIFKRGDDLTESVRDADLVVDVLSTNPTTKGLLDNKFFKSLKMGTIFISVTTSTIEDFDAIFDALNEGRLSFVAHDVADAKPGDATNELYKRLCAHPNVYTTPHIAGFSDATTKVGNDMMIDNVEAWIKGNPINVFTG